MNSSSGHVAGEEFGGLGLEVVELALDDRDHVPGTFCRTSGSASVPRWAGRSLSIG